MHSTRTRLSGLLFFASTAVFARFAVAGPAWNACCIRNDPLSSRLCSIHRRSRGDMSAVRATSPSAKYTRRFAILLSTSRIYMYVSGA